MREDKTPVDVRGVNWWMRRSDDALRGLCNAVLSKIDREDVLAAFTLFESDYQSRQLKRPTQ